MPMLALHGIRFGEARQRIGQQQKEKRIARIKKRKIGVWVEVILAWGAMVERTVRKAPAKESGDATNEIEKNREGKRERKKEARTDGGDIGPGE